MMSFKGLHVSPIVMVGINDMDPDLRAVSPTLIQLLVPQLTQSVRSGVHLQTSPS